MESVQVMERLSRRRPLFHSEADFQHAFAWELHQVMPTWDIRLEVPVRTQAGVVHLDLLACQRRVRIAIELKYKTRALTAVFDGEEFALADQAAQDIGRYDFFKDISRVEAYAHSAEDRSGYAVFLTNDSAYWKAAADPEHGYANFAMNEGRRVSGSLAWGDRASAGTRRNRESEVPLRGDYELRWVDYSAVEAKRYGQFRFACIEVPWEPV